MITITNVSERTAPTGQQTYRVAIVGQEEVQEIVTFTHEREDGLSVCLEKAADAVKVKRMMGFSDLLDDALQMQIDRQTETVLSR